MPVGVHKLGMSRHIGVGFLQEQNRRNEFHCILDSRVSLLCRRDIRQEVGVTLCKQSVVYILGRCNINLQIEEVIGNGCSGQRNLTGIALPVGNGLSSCVFSAVAKSYLGHIACLCINLVAGLMHTVCVKQEVDISSRVTVVVRGCTLTAVVSVFKQPVIVIRVAGVNLAARSMNTSKLRLNESLLRCGEVVCFKHQHLNIGNDGGESLGVEDAARTVRGVLVLLIVVVDAVAVVTSQHSGGVSGVSNEVLHNLFGVQRGRVNLHTVDSYIAGGRTNHERLGAVLIESVVAVIDERLAGNTIFIRHNESLSGFVFSIDGLDVDVQLNNIFFAVGHMQICIGSGDGLLAVLALDIGVRSTVGFQPTFVNAELNTHIGGLSSAIHLGGGLLDIGQPDSVFILNILSHKDKLHFGTTNAGVGFKTASEHQVVKCYMSTCFNQEVGVSICVDLITAVCPVKVGRRNHRVCSVCPLSVCGVVGHSSRVEVDLKVCLDGVYINAQSLHINQDGNTGVADLDYELVQSNFVRLEVPSVIGRCSGVSADQFTIDISLDSGRTGRRVEYIIGDDSGVILTGINSAGHLVIVLSCLAVVIATIDTADNRSVGIFVIPDNVLENVVGCNIDIADLCGHPHFQQV